MKSLATLLTSLVAALHVGFAVLEMILWEHPIGQGVFNTTEQFATDTAMLAANQGLYNLFLAAGLIWSLAYKKSAARRLFLTFVVAAGIFGAATVSPTIFFVQAVPAILALIISYLSRAP
ncbi:MAG: DUF1304 domain-containing protein [Alphaproteobacteria bacterium]